MNARISELELIVQAQVYGNGKGRLWLKILGAYDVHQPILKCHPSRLIVAYSLNGDAVENRKDNREIADTFSYNLFPFLLLNVPAISFDMRFSDKETDG